LAIGIDTEEENEKVKSSKYGVKDEPVSFHHSYSD
jgi:hypothetical protein